MLDMMLEVMGVVQVGYKVKGDAVPKREGQ